LGSNNIGITIEVKDILWQSTRMNSKIVKEKKKLCWNCEGSASFQDENCPFCGVYLSPLSISGTGLDAQLNPPYKLDEEQDEIPDAPYASSQEADDDHKEETVDGEASDVRTIALTMALLLSGIALTLFSFALLLFSHNGFFTLRWNADFWILYLLVACPLLFFGWRFLQRIN
jgi:hypothetical protein